jgi:hypothetical protein
MRLLALLVVLVPVLLARAGDAFAEEPRGITISELTFAEPIEFPPDTALYIATGCWQCDGPTSAIYRVSRAGYGPVHVDLVFKPADRMTQMIIDVAFSEDGSRILASLCDVGRCANIGQPTKTEETTLYWSDDGGMTWNAIGHLHGMIDPEAVTDDSFIYRDWLDETETYRFADGRPLTDDQAKKLVEPGGRDRWQWDAAAGTISIDGGPAIRISTEEYGPSVSWLNGMLPILSWYAPPASRGDPAYGYHLAVYKPEGPLRAFRSTGYKQLAGWVSDRLAAGTFEQRVPGQLHRTAMRPSVVDLEAGIVYPIADVFDRAPFGGRNYGVQVVRGPFWRVPGAECLPLRAWAAAFASQNACAAPGVLLTPSGGVRYEKGVEWREASMPNGTTGWVPRGSVEE